MSDEPSPLKEAIMEAVYAPLERDDMQTPCTLPFMTSSEHGVCDGCGFPVSDETNASALNAVAKIQTEYNKLKKGTKKGTQKEMTDEASPRPWRVETNRFGQHYVVCESGSGDRVRDYIAGPIQDESDARLIVDAVNERDRLLAAMKAIEDLCKVLDRTDLWEAREEWLDDAIYEIREKARAAIGEDKK